MVFNFYANILESNKELVNSKYVEGGKKVDKDNEEGIISKEEAKALYPISNKFMVAVFQMFSFEKMNRADFDNTIEALKRMVVHMEKYEKTKNNFELKDYDENNMIYFMEKNKIPGFRALLGLFELREYILKELKKLPPLAFNNNVEKKEKHEPSGISSFYNDLNDFIKLYEISIEGLPSEKKEKRDKKIFIEKYPISYWISTVRNFGKVKFFERKDIKNLIKKNNLKDTEIIFETKNYTFLKVGSYNDLSYVGCHSQWCISRHQDYWNKYDLDYVFVLINWQEDDWDDKFMHIITDPIMDEYGYVVYDDYGTRGFVDMNDKMAGSDKEIEKYWQPFFKELSEKEQEELLAMDKLIITGGQGLAEYLNIGEDSIKADGDEFIVNQNIEIDFDLRGLANSTRRIDSLVKRIKRINGDLTIYQEYLNLSDDDDVFHNNLIIDGNLIIKSSQINNLSLNKMRVVENIAINTDIIYSKTAIDSLPLLGGDLLIDISFLDYLRKALTDEEIEKIINNSLAIIGKVLDKFGAKYTYQNDSAIVGNLNLMESKLELLSKPEIESFKKISTIKGDLYCIISDEKIKEKFEHILFVLEKKVEGVMFDERIPPKAPLVNSYRHYYISEIERLMSKINFSNYTINDDYSIEVFTEEYTNKNNNLRGTAFYNSPDFPLNSQDRKHGLNVTTLTGNDIKVIDTNYLFHTIKQINGNLDLTAIDKPILFLERTELKLIKGDLIIKPLSDFLLSKLNETIKEKRITINGKIITN